MIFYDRAAQRFPFGSDGFSSHAAEYLFSKRQASKGAAKEKLEALEALERLSKKAKLSEKEIERIAVELGKKVTHRGS